MSFPNLYMLTLSLCGIVNCSHFNDTFRFGGNAGGGRQHCIDQLKLMWDDEPLKRIRSTMMKRKNSPWTGIEIRADGNPAPPGDSNVPLLWGDLDFALSGWGREVGIQAVHRGAIEMI